MAMAALLLLQLQRVARRRQASETGGVATATGATIAGGVKEEVKEEIEGAAMNAEEIEGGGGEGSQRAAGLLVRLVVESGRQKSVAYID